jgi:hypothetical protein
VSVVSQSEAPAKRDLHERSVPTCKYLSWIKLIGEIDLALLASSVVSSACSCLVTTPAPLTVYATSTVAGVTQTVFTTTFETVSTTTTVSVSPATTYLATAFQQGTGHIDFLIPAGNVSVQTPYPDHNDDYSIDECVAVCLAAVGDNPLMGVLMISDFVLCTWYLFLSFVTHDISLENPPDFVQITPLNDTDTVFWSLWDIGVEDSS